MCVTADSRPWSDATGENGLQEDREPQGFKASLSVENMLPELLMVDVNTNASLLASVPLDHLCYFPAGYLTACHETQWGNVKKKARQEKSKDCKRFVEFPGINNRL